MNVSHQYTYIFYQSRIYEQCLLDKAIKRNCNNRQFVSTIKLIKKNVRKSRRNLNVKQVSMQGKIKLRIRENHLIQHVQ